MATSSAALSAELRARLLERVTTRGDLAAAGFSGSTVTAQLEAGRWQRVGRAIVLHNGALSRHESWRAALINSGPRSVLTSFTALEAAGLTGWECDEVHVLVPGGGRSRRAYGLHLRVHETTRSVSRETHPVLQRHHVAPAAAIAAGSCTCARTGIGLLAAVVRQRLADAESLSLALRQRRRLRHRRVLLDCLGDIAMGSHALSGIDFVGLCRRAGLPEPDRQAVRVEPGGRRRYLDAHWTSRHGRTLTVEVDGALHLAGPGRWDDQQRQNLIVVTESAVLRLPSVLVRADEAQVVSALSRGLAMIGIPCAS